jgi:hypothetical protein
LTDEKYNLEEKVDELQQDVNALKRILINEQSDDPQQN